MKRQRQSNPKDDEEALLPLNNQFKDDDEGAKKGGFFACYLLCSLSPRFKGHTYIGFTVNPRRRIRQHNGEIKCGAFRTKSKRPWEMTLCIYGFPTNVSALQFEWAWQHPRESLAVRNAAATFKTLSGIANKVKLAYTMLTLSPWQSLKLTVNFFSTKYMKHAAGCPSLPKQMKVQFCPIDELHCYTNSDQILDEEGDGQEGEDESDENGKDYGHEELTDISVCDTLVHPCGTTTIDYNGMRRDATATIGQTKETLTLREDDDKSPFHLGDSPLRIPSSSNSCFANVTIAAENEDPLRLVQENCSKLGRASRQQMAASSSPNEDQERSATSLISSYQFGSTEPNDTSKKENSKCQYSLIDSPSETTFSCAFDLVGNNVETIEGRNFRGFAEGNNNGVGQAPEKQLRIPSVANNGKLPFTNGVHSSPEVEVINLLTPSSNSITRYFRKKKKVSSVSNEIIDLTRSPNFVQL